MHLTVYLSLFQNKDKIFNLGDNFEKVNRKVSFIKLVENLGYPPF